MERALCWVYTHCGCTERNKTKALSSGAFKFHQKKTNHFKLAFGGCHSIQHKTFAVPQSCQPLLVIAMTFSKKQWLSSFCA